MRNAEETHSCTIMTKEMESGDIDDPGSRRARIAVDKRTRWRVNKG